MSPIIKLIREKERIQNMKTTNPPTRNSRSPYPSPISNYRSLLIILLLALCCFAPCSTLQAVTPAPDGAYPGGNTAEGQNALRSLTSGTNNTALGFQALYHDTTGGNSAATGLRALYSNTTGVNNTATGSQTLLNNTTGSQNTANGYVALSSNTTGVSNTATGSGALRSNTSASHNTATGYIALYNNTTGTQNTATGARALYSNNTGNYNTANGYQALGLNTSGYANTAIGNQALYNNTSGPANTAIGHQALHNHTTGTQNIALGWGAGYNVTAGNLNIDIGNSGNSGDDRTIYIGEQGLQGATFIAGIYGVNEGGMPLAVYINSNGQLGTMSSSRRFKKEIKRMEQTSEAILALKPVTFQYKSDPAGAGPQFGLIAEEVAEVNPDLVVRDAQGEIYSVRYDAVNAMLLNEFLKVHRKVEEQEAAIAQQKKRIDVLTARLDEQASLIQKVSAQLDVIKPAPQMVLNSQ
jgi:hypothetical protein